ncbi:unnamed protein product [Cunninghamella echinulata]
MTMVDDKGNFSTAIEFWKSVNLVNLQHGLVSRKKLAEQTREKLQQFKGLLKGYQFEIDNITRRTKYAENAFLTVYKLLADAPDPIPLFDAAVEQSVKLVDFEHSEKENKQLKEQINKLQQENQRLSQIEETNKQLQQQNTQLKQTITKLEEKKKSEDLMQKENEMKAQYTNKIKSYKEREHDLQLQLNQALDQLTQLRATHDDTQAQLIGHNQKYDQEVVGKLAELDIIMMDLERANTRIVELENKNSELKNEIQSLNETQEDNSNFAKSDLHTQHELEMNRLMKDVETYKDLLQKTEQRTSKKLKELTTEIKSLTEHSESLRAKVKDMEDYHEIKRELAIMKYVEFSTGGGDDDEDDNTFNAKEVLNKDSIQQSLEVQLMEKNKKLENEYTQLKVNHHELEASFKENQTLLNELKTKVDEQQQLIHRLEEDLLQGIGKKSEDHSSTPPILQRNPSTSSLLDTRLSFDMSSSQQSPPPQQQSSKEEDKSILPIVMQQRDRFRQRNAELERHSRGLEQQLHDLRAEMDRLKEDNLKLYERLKFVHVWKEEQRNVNQSTIQMEPIGPSSRREFKKPLPTINDDPTDRYDKLYEENMNPFAQFHRKEERRRYNALNPADKLTLKMTRMMFSHKWTRYLLIVYALLLHLLVVATLYQLSLWECRHDHETFNTPTNMNMNINE